MFLRVRLCLCMCVGGGGGVGVCLFCQSHAAGTAQASVHTHVEYITHACTLCFIAMFLAPFDSIAFGVFCRQRRVSLVLAFDTRSGYVCHMICSDGGGLFVDLGLQSCPCVHSATVALDALRF